MSSLPATSTARAAPDTIIAVDMLRFACAMLVVLYHFGSAFWVSPSDHADVLLRGLPGLGDGPLLARTGWIGVELFFVISGFVIARSAIDARWIDFLQRRALRLVPAAWISATVTALALGASGAFDWGLADAWFRSIRFWPIGPQIDGVYWTLGVETAFYLLVALVAGGRATARRIDRMAAMLGAASAIFWAWCVVVGPGAIPIRDNLTSTLLLLPHGVFFAIGMVAAALVAGRERGWHGALLAMLVPFALIEIAAHAAGRAGAGDATALTVLACSIFAGGLSLLIWADRLQPYLARWLTTATARTLGLMTYPLYLLHQDAGAALLAVLAALGLGVVLGRIGWGGGMIGVAWGVARFAEPALRRALQALIRPRRGPARDIPPSAFLPTG